MVVQVEDQKAFRAADAFMESGGTLVEPHLAGDAAQHQAVHGAITVDVNGLCQRLARSVVERCARDMVERGEMPQTMQKVFWGAFPLLQPESNRKLERNTKIF